MLKVVIAPSEKLSIKAEPVINITAQIQQHLQDILQTLRAHSAIGLCGTHVGIHLQLIVIEIETNSPVFMVNPKILQTSVDKIMSEEGSVSFPGIKVPIQRHKEIKIQYLDYHGNEVIQNLHGLMSICAQHEIDQMNGITLLNGLSKLKRDFYMKKVNKSL